MNTVADILEFVETLAPRYMKMDWDNVGLLCGSKSTPVTKILVALDPFDAVCEEAAALGAELIVTHHGLIFQPLKAVTDETVIGRRILSLCRNGISAINAHTNLDCAPGGVNDRLAQILGLANIQVIDPMGINVNFAPVLDVNIAPMNPIIGNRSYGDDPQRVADVGCAVMEGMVEGGVIATLKHYPGHGNVNTDSHLDLPVNHTDPEVLEQTEFLPFQQAFDRGAPALMSCHIVFPKIDPNLPATLSPVIIGDLLRKKQGFDGLVFTDCMEMDAIQKGWGTAQGAVLAVAAGCDVLCISHHIEAVQSAVEAIEQAIYFVDKGNKTKLLAHLVQTLDVKNALVFTRTKHGANKVARDLEKSGITAAAIHGNKSQTARQQALADFKSGRIRCLVATDIAARGLDIEYLSHVFNYNLTEVPETYIHRIGRTGRAKRKGIAWSIIGNFPEKAKLDEIAKFSNYAITPMVLSPEGTLSVEQVKAPAPVKKRFR